MSEYSHRNTADLFKNTQVILSQQFSVVSWSPAKTEDHKPATEVHILATVFKFAAMVFVIRLKSLEVCQSLIDALVEQRDLVWPIEKK